MQTRRDQLHAYRFMTRRAMSALVTGEPDTVEPPMRRLTLMTISGIMVAIVVAAVFAVVGLLRGGGGDAWRTEGAVIVEKETGARFVMIEDTLHPVVNFASAVLATGSTGLVEAHQVSRSDLASVERGATIGVPGLPDSMPAQEDLAPGLIQVCSVVEAEGVNVSAVVRMEVGSGSAALLDSGEGLYVESFEGERFLLLEGRRHLVQESVEAALQINVDPVRVGSAFLSAIPVGAPFETPDIPGRGEEATLAGHQMLVGQVIEVDDGSFRVVLADGVARVDDVQVKLLRTMMLDGRLREPVAMSLSDVLGMPEVRGLGGQMGGLPGTMPEISDGAREAAGACAVFTESGTPARFAVPDRQGPPSAPATESEASRLGSADEVWLEPGTALLATSPGSTTVYLVAEPGRAYPAQSSEVLGGFGYGSSDSVQVPAEVLGIIPEGDALDPARARLPVG